MPAFRYGRQNRRNAGYSKEVFIIKSDNPDKVEEHLNTYKENLISKYNNKNIKEVTSIVKNTIVKSEKGITYLIASNNSEEIEKVIVSEINS